MFFLVFIDWKPPMYAYIWLWNFFSLSKKLKLQSQANTHKTLITETMTMLNWIGRHIHEQNLKLGKIHWQHPVICIVKTDNELYVILYKPSQNSHNLTQIGIDYESGASLRDLNHFFFASRWDNLFLGASFEGCRQLQCCTSGWFKAG